MSVHVCCVDECTTAARWERVSPADADLHEFLCSDHWKLLHQYNWIAAAAYRPLSSIPAAAIVDTQAADANLPSPDSH